MMPETRLAATRRTRPRRARARDATKLPPAGDWRTTDEDEIGRRRLRAREEQPRIRNLDPRHPIFSTFEVRSRSGMTYQVEIRDLARRQFHSTTVDFQINGLGTCKHTEAVLMHLEARFPREFASAERRGSSRIDVVPDLAAGTLKVERNLGRLSPSLRRLFDGDGRLRGIHPEDAVARLRESGSTMLRISQEVDPWLEARTQATERRRLRREYEEKVQAGIFPQHETKLPLYPYQREGMLHLAFTERALLADEMGLGKTIQAVAACSLLHRLGKARRALIVAPASLKTEWEEQIQKFTELPHQIVFGPRPARLRAYAAAPFFTIVNYEQMVRDSMEVNARLQPDVVILDEAQRIKNWSTKTAQAVKRLRSRYAFVLTGTPIENRIDDLYSIVNFVDPTLLGPLFRFNREFYELDDKGRPAGYKNLDRLRDRIRPFLIRRRKADVETELPSRTDRNLFVPMSAVQREAYGEHEMVVARLVSVAKRRPLTRQEQDKLMRELAMMRMLCDTTYILDSNDRTCPKLGELGSVLDTLVSDPEVKVVIFSEWVRMLELVRDLLVGMKLGYALHTGNVPQRRRRAEIQTFKSDPCCRVFLSTDSGGVGLNLQAASVVINCDLPWNPAKLEQRIARVWRKHQMRNVTVLNLISEETIEHRMLETLAAKRGLSDGVLDGEGDLANVPLRRGAQAFMDRLRQVIGAPQGEQPKDRPRVNTLPADRSAGFAARASEILGPRLVACEERYPEHAAHSVVLVVVEGVAAAWTEKVASAHEEFFGDGKGDPVSPVRLQVIDRATFEALERLKEAGLIESTVRATRHLYPAPEREAIALTEEEKRSAAELRQQADRKLTMARVLSAGALDDEARDAMLAALHLLGRVLAIENRLPAPHDVGDLLRAPLARAWGVALEHVREIVERRDAPLRPTIEALGAVRAEPEAVPTRAGGTPIPPNATGAFSPVQIERRIGHA